MQFVSIRCLLEGCDYVRGIFSLLQCYSKDRNRFRLYRIHPGCSRVSTAVGLHRLLYGSEKDTDMKYCQVTIMLLQAWGYQGYYYYQFTYMYICMCVYIYYTHTYTCIQNPVSEALVQELRREAERALGCRACAAKQVLFNKEVQGLGSRAFSFECLDRVQSVGSRVQSLIAQ